MSRKPYNPIIASDKLWEVLAPALGIEREHVKRVELVLEAGAPVRVSVHLVSFGADKLTALDWPQFDPSQITIVEQG